MKKLFLIIILFLFSCETTVETKQLKERYFGSKINVMFIENCEYIYVNQDVRSLTHKGNCNNVIHK